VLSILANIARKVDRLEYVQDGAVSTPDEAHLDTAIDLLVYCLKYQAYLADLDPKVAARLFGAGRVSPPYSDGRAGFEARLAQTDLVSVTAANLPAAEAAPCVVSRFAELEACFRGVTGIEPVPVRTTRVLELTAAAVALVGALRCEDPQNYVAFIDSWITGERRRADAR
jgi:hypothetical protein